MTTRCLSAIGLALLLVTVFCPASADDARFVRLDDAGQPLPDGHAATDWPCVLDTHSGLVWEVKTRRPGLHQRDLTFHWQPPGQTAQASPPDCRQTPCSTAELVQAVNHQGWCGAHDWRLPQREELRSLVDYSRPYPGPTLDTRYFPNAVSQFHWSATPSADDAQEAWGIGFAFGFDYAYPHSNRTHVRLVRDAAIQ